jgi:ribosome-binding factor A
MDAARARKLSDRIARIVAEMLERRVKDPRLGFVTVTAARLTNDLREATVFYTVYGSAEERAETGLRHTPSLAFVADTVPEGARRMEDLVAQARAADARLAAAREGAVWAGDADPYRPAPGSAEDGQPGAAEDDPRGAAGDGQPGAAEARAAEDGRPGSSEPGGQRGSGDDRVGGAPGGGDLLSGTPGGGDHGAGYSPA